MEAVYSREKLQEGLQQGTEFQSWLSLGYTKGAQTETAEPQCFVID